MPVTLLEGTMTITRILFSVTSLALVAGCGSREAVAGSCTLRDPTAAPAAITVTIANLDGDQFRDAQVFSGFGCTGENRSPALSWSGAPEGTQSYALIMHDPDAPTGVGFFHWTALNLPGDATSLEEGASGNLPEGALETYTDFGQTGYGGPCPPPGTPHRYEITVYALRVPNIDLPTGATGALVRFALREHTLAIGRATAMWGR